MKISSKSILSPGRVRDPPPISLSTSSLTRRLKTSRSIKGGASPAMFPVTGKKRGCGFDIPEPSSPKVTCIGQVRVKSKKKHAKNLRSLSTRRSSGGEVSFRKFERIGSQSQHPGSNNNQRWVHLPLTICEALGKFGSEVSCLFPCRSSCSSIEGNGGRDAGGGDDGGRREMELVAGDDEEEMGVGNLRRHVFQDLEIVNDCIIGNKDDEEAARVSICVPPKNALLLMRGRSDPMKIEALTNRLWEPIVGEIEDEDEEFVDFQEKNEDDKIHQEDLKLQKLEQFMVMDEINDQQHDDLQEYEVNQEIVEVNSEMEMKQSVQEEEDDEKQSIDPVEEEEESMFLRFLFEENADQDQQFEEFEKEMDMVDAKEELFEETETGESKLEKVKRFEEEIDEAETGESKLEIVKPLPECLLLMMYEPKLSMEVSKETWVCSTDFNRRHSCRKKPPPPPVKPIDGQPPQQLARSSCSFPAPPSIATMLEPKLVNTSSAYELLGLKRCKSEPRTAAAKLAPEACFWKNKLEPPRRASFYVGMAGLGF